MKKKILSLTLAMSMMTTMGATVFASNDIQNGAIEFEQVQFLSDTQLVQTNNVTTEISADVISIEDNARSTITNSITYLNYVNVYAMNSSGSKVLIGSNNLGSGGSKYLYTNVSRTTLDSWKAKGYTNVYVEYSFKVRGPGYQTAKLTVDGQLRLTQQIYTSYNETYYTGTFLASNNTNSSAFTIDVGGSISYGGYNLL